MTVRKLAGFSSMAANAVAFFDAQGDLATDTDLTFNPTTGELKSAASVETGITASTTQTQVGGYALTKPISNITVCANANDAVTLPAALAGRQCIVRNGGAQTMRVFPASGDNCGGGVDTAVTQATTVSVTYVAIDSTTWVVIA